DEDESEATLIDTGVKLLEAFVAKVPKPERTIDVEVPFSIELAHPVTGEILPLPLIGALDAIVVESGHDMIWELKTARRRWDENAREHDLQPTAYSIAAGELGFGDAPVKLVVGLKWARPDVQIEQLVRDRRDQMELVETALSVHRAVESGIDH